MKKENGQGLTEFAFVVPVLLVVAFGLFDLGRAYFAVITISNASREGARYLTLHPDDNMPDAYGNTYSGTKQAAVAETQGSFINITPADVSVTYCLDADMFPGCDSGYPVIVSVSHDFVLILGWFLPSPIPLTRSTQMLVP
jgi:Flp pilus assembly protein TadG